jgi:hypothetical protein
VVKTPCILAPLPPLLLPPAAPLAVIVKDVMQEGIVYV